VLEALETIFNVFWHQEMHLLAWVIPLNGESTVSFSFFFNRALIIFLDRLQEVLGVLLTGVFDSKVVDDQRERNGTPLVLPQTGSGLALRIAMFLQSFGEEFLCYDPRLGESVHALADLAVHVSIRGCDVAQFVVLDDIVRHVRKFQTHVFIHDHWGIQIEVFYVHGEESCARCGYDAVDEELHGK
jgi:hypothetical protein